MKNEIIKSIGYDQQEIINNILKLYNNGKPIDFDPCYNVGGFYKNNGVEQPLYKSDINPQFPDVRQLDVRFLPYINHFKCIIFDPPFIAGGGSSSTMAKKYGSFKSVEELHRFYINSLISLQRALTTNGILIIKCQDFVNGRKNHIIINDILNLARALNFEILDIFILLAKTRPNNFKTQQHARKYHSYFLVLKK